MTSKYQCGKTGKRVDAKGWLLKAKLCPRRPLTVRQADNPLTGPRQRPDSPLLTGPRQGLITPCHGPGNPLTAQKVIKASPEPRVGFKGYMDKHSKQKTISASAESLPACEPRGALNAAGCACVVPALRLDSAFAHRAHREGSCSCPPPALP